MLRVIRKTNNPGKLARIAKKNSTRWIARVALERIEDPSLLADVAKNARDGHVCLDALERISDQALLVDIAKHAECYSAREKAVSKLDDQYQELFADLARNDTHAHVRITAMRSLDEQHQEFFADRARNDSYRAARVTAVEEKLTDQSLLADLAKNSLHEEVRLAAIKKLTGQHQELFADVVKNDSARENRVAALKKLTDANLLKEVARNILARDVRNDLWEGVREQVNCLKHLAEKHPGIITASITREEWEKQKQLIESLGTTREETVSEPRYDSGVGGAYGSYSGEDTYTVTRVITAADNGIRFPPYPAPVDQKE
jgi:hypothetical protein